METTTDTKSTITLLIEKILSYKTLFFNIVTTIGYALSPAMNKSLHAALERGIQALVHRWRPIVVTMSKNSVL